MSGSAQVFTVARCLPSVEKNTILPGRRLRIGFDRKRDDAVLRNCDAVDAGAVGRGVDAAGVLRRLRIGDVDDVHAAGGIADEQAFARWIVVDDLGGALTGGFRLDAADMAELISAMSGTAASSESALAPASNEFIMDFPPNERGAL